MDYGVKCFIRSPLTRGCIHEKTKPRHFTFYVSFLDLSSLAVGGDELSRMTKTLGPKQWSRSARKNYWIRFSDHTFGKISFRMHAGGDHFAVIEGFRNPSPNDRNLEPKLDSR